MANKIHPNDFEQHVRDGYYDSNIEADWCSDFEAFLISQGVPEIYAKKVRQYCDDHGHSHGYSNCLNVSYDVIEIFK